MDKLITTWPILNKQKVGLFILTQLELFISSTIENSLEISGLLLNFQGV